MSRGVDKKLVAKKFLQSAESYSGAAVIQGMVAKTLVAKLRELKETSFPKVLEIGCGTGLLTRLLAKHLLVEDVWLNDLVDQFEEDCTQLFSSQQTTTVHGIFGDAETLSFPDNFDLIISSSTLQWFNDPLGFLRRITDCLANRGLFVFSICVEGTMREFKAITDVGLQYLSPDHIEKHLQSSIDILYQQNITDSLYFENSRDVLQHIRASGVGGVTQSVWNKKSLMDFHNQYDYRFRDNRGYPVTYAYYLFIGRKK